MNVLEQRQAEERKKIDAFISAVAEASKKIDAFISAAAEASKKSKGGEK